MSIKGHFMPCSDKMGTVWGDFPPTWAGMGGGGREGGWGDKRFGGEGECLWCVLSGNT